MTEDLEKMIVKKLSLFQDEGKFESDRVLYFEAMDSCFSEILSLLEEKLLPEELSQLHDELDSEQSVTVISEILLRYLSRIPLAEMILEQRVKSAIEGLSVG